MSRKSDNVVIRLRKLIEEEKLRKSSDFLAEFFRPPCWTQSCNGLAT